MIFFVVYMAYENALSRGNFLASSNNSALGLMLSTGDIFQIKNLSKSFLNEATTSVFLSNASGEKVCNTGSDVSGFTPFYGPLYIAENGVFLLTSNKVNYNGLKVGEIWVFNRLLFGQWLSTIIIMLLINIFGFLVQGRILRKFLVFMGAQFKEIESIFKNTNDSEELENLCEKRVSTQIAEVESLANTVRKLVDNLHRSANIEKDAAIGRISAHLTHDMRAPIGTFERLLYIKDEDFPTMKHAIRESVSRLYTMVEALRHGELESLVSRAWTTLDFEFGYQSLLGQAEKRCIKFTVPQEKVENIYADSLKLERAWINLASNALEFAKSSVRVEVELKGPDVILRVLDDGPGVPDEFIPKLFQRGATLGKQDGTGLGLAYVKQIVQGHGGDVSYRREDSWTIFECHLPYACSESEVYPMNQTQVLEIVQQPLVTVKVAICLQPRELSLRILDELRSSNSEKFFFSEERVGAAIVVSNVEDIMMEVLESDDQEYFSMAQCKEDLNLILYMLKRKFEISQ